MLRDVLARREDEERLRREGRLPPGQSLTLKFPVLHYGPVPRFDQATWDFRAWGEVEEEKHWNWDEFQKLPRAKIQMDIHCVTRWSKFDTTWEGVSVGALVREGLIRLKPTAKYVMQHCESISPDHGYPVRGVVGYLPGQPDLQTPYFWKGGKWLRALEFMSQDRLGFWEQAGYHNEADIWKEQRMTSAW